MNEQFLEHIGNGIEVLLDMAGDHLSGAVENESQFSLTLEIDSASLATMTDRLRPYLDFIHVTLRYDIHDGRGIADFDANGNFLVHEWDIDDELTPQEIVSSEAINALNRLHQSLVPGTSITATSITADLAVIDQAGGDISLRLTVEINKNTSVAMLGSPDGVRLLFYVLTSKFLSQFESKESTALQAFLTPNEEIALILLLSDAVGIGTGPNLCISGRNYWHSTVKFVPDETDRKKVKSALKFRNDECNWEIATSTVTPHHLFLEQSSINRAEVVQSISRKRDQLAVMYMADHVKLVQGQIHCQLKGYKPSWIGLPTQNTHESSPAIFKLFAWAYENSSSDKLGIARQITTLYLNEDINGNYLTLAKKADDILRTAKGNFQIFLRGNAELYFDKRLKVSQFLQKFSEDISRSVSQMTSELISNLYKTVGVLVGVLIAGIVDSSMIPTVIYWTALFYLAYIVFIIVYLLPSVLFIFIEKASAYHKSVQELTDVLTSEEITRLEGNTFVWAKRLFWVYFVITIIIYVVLGVVAGVFMRTYS